MRRPNFRADSPQFDLRSPGAGRMVGSGAASREFVATEAPRPAHLRAVGVVL